MENKSNEATQQRPEGDRMLNAPLVEMDLNKLIDQMRNESTWKESDRNSITIFKSESMRIVLIGLHEDAELKTHTANGIISVQVLEGKINFTTEQQTVSLAKRQMIALQEKIPHSVLALKESFFLLTLAMHKL
jgi:quercetin dioxygenase-like cupin family protein